MKHETRIEFTAMSTPELVEAGRQTIGNVMTQLRIIFLSAPEGEVSSSFVWPPPYSSGVPYFSFRIKSPEVIERIIIEKLKQMGLQGQVRIYVDNACVYSPHQA